MKRNNFGEGSSEIRANPNVGERKLSDSEKKIANVTKLQEKQNQEESNKGDDKSPGSLHKLDDVITQSVPFAKTDDLMKAFQHVPKKQIEEVQKSLQEKTRIKVIKKTLQSQQDYCKRNHARG